jgi:hypothetical protein
MLLRELDFSGAAVILCLQCNKNKHTSMNRRTLLASALLGLHFSRRRQRAPDSFRDPQAVYRPAHYRDLRYMLQLA